MSRERPAGQPPLPLRLVLAVAGGAAIAAAFPAYDQSYAAWLGCALLAAAGWCARWRTGLLVGLLAGWAYFLPTLSWSGVYVGRLPWFALATLQALYVAAMLAVVGPLQRRLVSAGRAWAAYLVVPLAWMVGEWARSTTPFGGFPWARLAFSQADSPLRNLASIGGAPLLGAAVAGVGVLLLAAVHAGVRGRAMAMAAALVATAALTMLPAALIGPPIAWGPGGSVPTARIALIQGNVPRPGLEFNAERRAVLDNHVRVTEELMARPGTGAVDLVVWPENAADIDPIRNADAAAQVTRALTATKAPLLIGAILDEPAPQVTNASLLYTPGTLDPQRYVKRHPVPFAEYVPFRDFFRLFNDKVDLVRAGMARGTEIGSFEVATRSGATFAALPTICFEVAYDGLVRSAVTDDPTLPSVIVVQTNNATFGYTAESEQQYAISRIRAIEHARPVVHVSTVGVSGFIGPDGTGPKPSSLFTAYGAVHDVRPGIGLSIADRLGRAPEYAALAALLLAWGTSVRRPRRAGPSVPDASSTKELTSA